MKLTDFEEIIDDNYMDTKLFSSNSSNTLNNNNKDNNNDDNKEQDDNKIYSSIIYKENEFEILEKSDCSNLSLGLWDNIKKNLLNLKIFLYLII